MAGTVQSIREGDKVTHSGRGADVPQVLSRWAAETLFAKRLVLLLHDGGLRVQYLDVCGVGEVARVLDPSQLDRAVEERIVFLGVVETEDFSWSAEPQ